MPTSDMPAAIGPYRPLERIGAGGFGTVYLARGDDGRMLAVKVLDARLWEVDGAALKRRVEREVETMHRVRSRYVAEVVDHDLDADPPYLVTQYVAGLSLDAVVARNGALRAERILRLARGLAQALADIHAAGCVHRDLKPRNVMMQAGDPVVIDFGVAHDVEATRLTRDGATGTPGYMAPELLTGGDAGPPVDVFGWAATVGYAATGRHVFPGDNEQARHWRVMNGQPDLHDVPEALVPLLREALAVDPADRPDSAALLDRLAALVPRRGADRRIQVEISLTEADTGTSHRLPDGRVVNIPAGHTRVTLEGQGEPGRAGGPPGDLLAEVEVRPDGDFERRGADLHTRRRIAHRLAAGGGPLEVPVAARNITLSIPAGAAPGDVIKAPGQGLPRPDGAGRGDLYVELDVAPAPLPASPADPIIRPLLTARRARPENDYLPPPADTGAAPVKRIDLVSEYGAVAFWAVVGLLVIGLPVGLVNYDGRRNLVDTTVAYDQPKISRSHDWIGNTTTVRLDYPVTANKRYQTSFRSGKGNTRYVHSVFRLSQVGRLCGELQVPYQLRLRGGRVLASGTLTPKALSHYLGYTKVGVAPVLDLTVGPVSAGTLCAATFSLQNPYLHSLPSWLSFMAQHDTPTRGKAK